MPHGNLGVPKTAEHRRNISLGKKGIPNLRLRGRKRPQAEIEKWAKKLRGKKHSAAHRKKNSEAAKRRWQRPEYRQRVTAALKKKGATPEYRERMRSNALKSLKFPRGRTTAPEKAIQTLLSSFGIKFSPHSEIKGARKLKFLHPYDLLLVEDKVAIEVNGCHWHGCPRCNKKMPTIMQRTTIERDRQIKEMTSLLGWTLIVFWEHQIGTK